MPEAQDWSGTFSSKEEAVPHRAWRYGTAGVPRDAGAGGGYTGTAWAQAASRSSRTLGSDEPSGCVASHRPSPVALTLLGPRMFKFVSGSGEERRTERGGQRRIEPQGIGRAHV